MENRVDKIKKICQERSINKKELATMTGLCEKTISNIFNGKNSPSKITLLSISNALNIRGADLSDETSGDKKDMKTVGDNIRELCDIKGLRLEELANISGVHYRTISYIVNNGQKPKYRTLIAIADALELEVQELYPVADIDRIDARTLGERVEQICKMRNMSMRELSFISGVAFTTICNVIGNKVVSRTETLEKIAIALDVKTELLYPTKEN